MKNKQKAQKRSTIHTSSLDFDKQRLGGIVSSGWGHVLSRSSDFVKGGVKPSHWRGVKVGQ
jgi:hypothetical protein